MRTVGSMMEDRDWRLEYFKKTVEYLEEKINRGEKEITVDLRWLQQVMIESAGYQANSLHLQRMLLDMACAQVPAIQRIVMPEPANPVEL